LPTRFLAHCRYHLVVKSATWKLTHCGSGRLILRHRFEVVLPTLVQKPRDGGGAPSMGKSQSKAMIGVTEQPLGGILSVLGGDPFGKLNCWDAERLRRNLDGLEMVRGAGVGQH
jgi:hypothetical protein